MAPPISPSDLQRVLKALPPEEPDPFPHLADLNADQLIQRRVEVTGTIKTLEQERLLRNPSTVLIRFNLTSFCSNEPLKGLGSEKRQGYLWRAWAIAYVQHAIGFQLSIHIKYSGSG